MQDLWRQLKIVGWGTLGLVVLVGFITEWLAFYNSKDDKEVTLDYLKVSKRIGFRKVLEYYWDKANCREEVQLIEKGRCRLKFLQYNDLNGDRKWEIMVWYPNGDIIKMSLHSESSIIIRDLIGDYGRIFDEVRLDKNPKFKKILDEAWELYKRARIEFNDSIRAFKVVSSIAT